MNEKDTESKEAMPDEWAEAMAEQSNAESGAAKKDTAKDAKPGSAGTESAKFQELKPDAGAVGNPEVNLDAILDVPVVISMEIGRTKINIRNLLQLNQGSVVELDRLAGEPMDVLVNGTLVAQGEVVVVNEKFGIRLTDIISPADRVKRLS
jgi:flagellar motor switch protein FliN/FliY